MDLLLWRHAEAFDAEQAQSQGMADADRPLTKRGERQAERVARWLQRELPASARVLVSPTVRTRQTAARLDRKWKVVDEVGPEHTVDALLQAARWPDAKEPVLIVGHQSALGLTAAYLMTGLVQPWSVRKGALWWLRARERQGQRDVVLHTVLAPERL